MNNIVLLGNGHAAIESFRNIIKSFNVTGVIIPYKDEIIEKLCLENSIEYSYNIIDLEKFNPDICLMISYGILIPNELIMKYNFINVHYGLLPKYRGMHTVAWAIINGEKEVGYTIHKVDKQIDNGDILRQEKIKVHLKDNIDIIMKKLDNLLENKICEFLKDYINGEVDIVKQDINKATFFCKRNLIDCRINWNDSTYNILNFIRALTPPYPGAYTRYKEEEIIIISAEEFNNERYIEIPGHVLYIIEDVGFIVKTGDTTILVKEIMVNKKIMPADKYFNTVGARLL